MICSPIFAVPARHHLPPLRRDKSFAEDALIMVWGRNRFFYKFGENILHKQLIVKGGIK